jgi:predicted TIM-barrel fold metal-dependent hydrolase
VDKLKHAPLALALTAAVACTSREPAVDPQLAGEIAKIKAIDNHAHPVRPTGPGEAADTEYDALPVENLEPSSDPVRLRPNAPELAEARRQLFQNDKAKAAREHSSGYAVWILDQLGIETMLANRVALGEGLPSPRFLWVPFDDALMYPLENDSLIHNSDQKAFFALEEKLLRRYYSECGLSARPASLDEYLNKVVRATLERQKQGGAVAVKFEMAYLRSLDIGNPTRSGAEQAWNARGDRKALQDYIFRFIATEAGRLGLAVHFHTGFGGGSYFNVSGSNPMLLEPLFDDPSLRKTIFVMLHGGWPFTREITALLQKPNAYLDFSVQALVHYPPEFSQTIRAWLEFVPEKVLFGTDAYPYSPEMGWEEGGFIATSGGREALGLALTGMLHDHEITRERALELARMVLRDNARKLYGLK